MYIVYRHPKIMGSFLFITSLHPSKKFRKFGGKSSCYKTHLDSSLLESIFHCIILSIFQLLLFFIIICTNFPNTEANLLVCSFPGSTESCKKVNIIFATLHSTGNEFD